MLEGHDRVHTERELLVFVAAVKRKSGGAGGALVPVPAAFGPDDEVGVRPPVQPGRDIEEIPRETPAVPRIDARDVSGARDAYPVVVTHPLGAEIGRPAGIQLVQQILVDAVPFRVCTDRRRILLGTEIVDAHVLEPLGQLLLHHQAVHEAVLVARDRVIGNDRVLGSDGNGVGDLGAAAGAAPPDATHEIQRIVVVLEHLPAAMEASQNRQPFRQFLFGQHTGYKLGDRIAVRVRVGIERIEDGGHRFVVENGGEMPQLYGQVVVGHFDVGLGNH